MANGVGLAAGFGAGGASDALTDLLKQKYLEQVQRQAQAERQQAVERQDAQDAESTRRWNLTHERGLAADQSLADSRAAEAARDRAEADKAARRTEGLQRFIDDPSTPPHLRTLLSLNALGVGNVGIHDVETPEVHAAHVRADNQLNADSEFAQWQRRADYTEGQRRSRPVRAIGARVAPGQDDPGLPFGSQRYISAIRQKHGTFEQALAELNAYLADPQTQRDHPGLSPQRATNALRQLYTGAGRPADPDDDVEAAVGDALAGVGLGGGRAGGAGRVPGAGGQSGGTVKMRAPNGQESDVPAHLVEHYRAKGAVLVP